VQGGSTEALAALLGLGGASVLAADASEEAPLADGEPDSGVEERKVASMREGSSGPCLLSLCVERSDVAMLGLLLEHLRGARSGLGLPNVRRALAAAERSSSSDSTSQELLNALSSHLVVELSHLGNAQYRHAELEAAISSYEEAIVLCEKSAARSSALGTKAPAALAAKRIFCESGDDSKGRPIASISSSKDLATQFSESTRENMVRLRYNLARTLHRSDRWADARKQASEVIALDNAYANAYALRAQAAMASCDWQAAVADWDALMGIIVSSQGSHTERADLVATWKKRREECITQLSCGHYEVLNLRRIASIDEVRQAYRELARQWHPDKHSHRSRDLQDRAHRRFERIRQAYDILSDEEAKHNYDATLLLAEARPLMTGHGTASSIRGEKSEAASSRGKSTESLEKPSACQSPSQAVKRASLKPSVTTPELDGDEQELRHAAKGSRTDSPVGRWLPSFRKSKTSPSGNTSGKAAVHVNLFDTKFVSADAAKNPP